MKTKNGLSFLGLSLLALVAMTTSTARAQSTATGPTLLVIGTVSPDSDPSVGAAATEALQAVARERGYTIVSLAPTAPRPAIDLRSGDSLAAFTAQTGVDRTLHLHVFRDGAGHALHLGLGSRDGTPAISMLRIADVAGVGATLTEMARALLPAPGALASGQWIAPPDATAAVTTSEVPPAPTGQPTGQPAGQPVQGGGVMATTSASAFAPSPEPIRAQRPARPQRDRTPLALTIAGAAMLGGGWVLNWFGGIFAGYSTCLFGGCSSGFDPAWDGFRAASFVPVIGPWIQIAILPNYSNYWPLWLVIDGLLQTAGAAMLIAGLSMDSGDEGEATPQVSILPSFGPDHARLDLVGTF